MDLGFLRSVAKPTRYTGGEVNEVIKRETPGLLHVALAFPDCYDIGMSTTGLKILYQALNDREDVWAERVFMPMPDMAQELERRRLPLYALESKRALSSFDAVGFTLQFELTYTNVLHMLRLGGVPLLAAERGPSDPVVLAGGPCAVNPEPVAPFFDAVFIGDGEEGALELCEVVRATRGRPRAEVWRALAGVPGTYVPALYGTEADPATGMETVAGPLEPGVPFPVERRIFMDAARSPFPHRLIVPHHQVTHDRYTIEIARGCAVGCRFCQAGFIYRPVRERGPEDVRKTVQAGLRATGFNEVTLLSLNAGEYDGIERLVGQVAADGASHRVGVAMPSLRVSSLTPELAASLAAGRKSGFTLAPEAGTQRLRDVINKQVGDGDLERAAKAVFGAGWSAVKLYFMLGLPTETEEDVDGIERLGRMVVRAGREAGRRNAQVTVSTSCFVPKPFTPFQWQAMASREILTARQDRLKKALGRPMTYKWHDVDASVVEGALSLGDRRMAKVLLAAADLGCRLDGWNEFFRWDLWREAFTRCGLTPEAYLYRERDRRERLPWDHIDIGVTKPFLWAERQKAFAGQTTSACGPEDCHGCGFFAPQCLSGELGREPVGPAPPPLPKAGEAGRVYRYRLRFRKEGLARFLGHLDLVEVLVRAMRRCGIRLAYSKGYHPMPRVELPPPLPLGVEGRAEWVEFFAGSMDREAAVAGLAGALPQGLVPERLFLVPTTAGPLSALSVQVYGVDCGSLEEEAADRLHERVAAFRSAASWPVQRHGKGDGKTLDLKERVLGMAWQGRRLEVRMVQGGFMDLVESLCPGPERETLALSRLGLDHPPAG